MKRRIISLLLALVMLIGMLPMNVLAADADGAGEGLVSIETSLDGVLENDVFQTDEQTLSVRVRAQLGLEQVAHTAELDGVALRAEEEGGWSVYTLSFPLAGSYELCLGAENTLRTLTIIYAPQADEPPAGEEDSAAEAGDNAPAAGDAAPTVGDSAPTEDGNEEGKPEGGQEQGESEDKPETKPQGEQEKPAQKPARVALQDAGLGSVRVIVENNTTKGAYGNFWMDDATEWTGTRIDMTVPLQQSSTALSVVVDAVKSKGYTIYENLTTLEEPTSYIAAIDGLKADSSSGSYSGWCVALNDWYTAMGIASYTYQNGTLKDGDVVRASYSVTGGSDVSSWYNKSDKKLADLTLTGGTLNPKFVSGTDEYELVVGETGSASVSVTPAADNKVFLACTYLNLTESELANLSETSWYQHDKLIGRGEKVTVKEGDTLYVVVGAKKWPSQANGSYGCYAEEVEPRVYKLKAVKTATNLNAGFDDYFSASVKAVATITNDETYPFAVESGVLKSTNKGKSNSNAAITFTFNKAAKLTFSYKASSEKTYDYLKISRNGTVLNSGYADKGNFSGVMTDFVSYSIEAQAGDVIALAYSKDSSGDKNDDCVYLKDFSVSLPNKVIFHANDGTEKTTEQAVFGSGNLSTNTFTREGYRFDGWATSAAGTVSYPDGAEITLSGSDVNLYAVWTKVWKVTFPQMPAGAAITVKQGETVIEPSEAGVWILADGSYTVSASLFGYVAKENVAFTVSGADVASSETLESAAKTTVTFTFTGLASGAQATLTVLNSENNAMPPKTEGAYVYELPAGEYTYSVSAKGYKTVKATVLTVSGESQSVTVTMTALGKWDGATVAESFAGGDGTKDSPYEIESGAELAYLSALIADGASGHNYNTYYVLTADIDLDSKDFTPIGNDSGHVFAGKFNGAGHTISNLKVNKPDASNGGLFGRASGTIENLTLDGASVTAGSGSYGYAGALVGYLTGTVQNCLVKNSTVTSTGDYVGGMVGQTNSKLTKCGVVKTTVSGANRVGGLVGQTSTSVEICYAANISVTASGEFAGGLIGCTTSSYGTLAKLFARGSVQAKNYAAGILGGYYSAYGSSKASLKNCYAVVDVTATDGSYGALGARNVSPTAASSFYYEGSSFSGTEVAGGTAKTLDELKSEAVLSKLGTSDFEIYAEGNQTINAGLPYLKAAPAMDQATLTNLTAPTISWSGKTASWAAVTGATGYQVTLTKSGETTPAYTGKQTELSRDFTTEIELGGSGSYTVSVTALGDGERYADSSAAVKEATFTVSTGSVLFTITRADGLAFAENNQPVITVTMADGKTTLSFTNNTAKTLPLGSYTYTVTAKTFGAQTGSFTLTEAGQTIALALVYSPIWDGETTLEPAKDEAGVYQISSGYELAWFRDEVNSSSLNNTLSAKLTDNIDLGGHAWDAISLFTSSYPSRGYTGTFDGNGKKISGLNPAGAELTSYGSTKVQGAGLFGCVYTGGTVKNLTVEGTLDAVQYSGGVAAIVAGGTVENCVSRMSITTKLTSGSGFIGGVVGSTYSAASVIRGCRNEGAIDCAAVGYVGGVLGQSTNGSTVENCVNTASVKGADRVGGIVGHNSAVLTACYNTGSVTGTKGDIGGIAGYANYNLVKNCFNAGSVTGSKDNIGGVIGQLNNTGSYAGSMTGCLNSGAVSVTDESIDAVGALVGAEAENPKNSISSSYYLNTTYTKAIGANAQETDEVTAITSSELSKKALIGLLGGAFASVPGRSTPGFFWQSAQAKAVVTFLAPEGAAVAVDGKTAVSGEPGVYELENGTYSYTVTKTGFDPATGTVTVAGESQKVEISLHAETFAVTFTVNTPGAELTVQNEAGVAMSPTAENASVYRLPNGTYTYTVSKFGFTSQTGTVTVNNGAVNVPAITLVGETMYTVTFTFTDEENLPTTPASLTLKAGEITVSPDSAGTFVYSVPAGSYTYKIEDTRYYTVEDTLTVTNANVTKAIRLEFDCTWDGETKTEVTPTAEGIYEISNAAELAWFAAQVNSGSTTYSAKLTANIYINNGGSTNTWTSIGGYSKEYTGTFDGNGKKIYGLNAPLFGYNGAGSLVKNLTVYGEISGESNVGAICAASYGSFENCVNYAKVSATEQRVGGIVGVCYAGGSIKNCVNHGAISSSNTGYSETNSYANVGGIAGMSYVPVSGCYNTGSVTASSDTYGGSEAGGIVGTLSDAALTHCYNTGTVSGAHRSGGIIGTATGGAAIVSNSYNVGTITVIGTALNPYCGAVAGELKNSASVQNCYFLDKCYVYAKGDTVHTNEGIGNSTTEGVIIDAATCKTVSEMKLDAFAMALSPTEKAFNVDNANLNGGYPVLSWQGGRAPEASQDEKDVAADKLALSVTPSVVTASGKLTLASSGANGSKITWSSSNEAVIKNDGTVTLPTETDAVVTLTATISKGAASDTKEFTITVKTQASADKAELDKIAEKLKKTFRVAYNVAGANVTDTVKEALEAAIDASGAALAADDITVTLGNVGSVAYGSDTNPIAANGAVTYYYADPSTSPINGDLQVNGVSFKLTAKSGANVTLEGCMVQIPWDQARVEQEMQKAAALLTFETIKGENTDETQVTKNLVLPYKLDGYGWATISWTAYPMTVVSITDNGVLADSVGKVTPAEADTEVTLDALFTFNKNNEEADGIITVSKQIKINVPGKASGYQASIDAALEKFTLAELKYAAGAQKGEVIDPDAVSDAVSLPTPSKLGIDGGRNGFKVVYSASVSSGTCPVSISGYRANVVRPIAETATEVTLKLSITKQTDGVLNPAYTGSKELKIKISPLKPSEITAEATLLDKVKAEIFAGLNDNKNVAADAITQDLHAFKEAYLDESGKLCWVYNVKDTKNIGIVPTDLPKEGYDESYNLFHSSNPGVIKHENLLVTCPETENAAVTITLRLKSYRFGDYYETYKDDETYGEVFKRLAGEQVTLTLTVLSKAEQKTASDLTAAIEALFPVTAASGDAIESVQTAYNALSSGGKKLVANADKLAQAKSEYDALVEAAEQEQKDKDAAAAVDALIDEIGEVTLESEAKIEAAQEAYAALSENAKKYVTKLDTLKKAQEDYDALVEAAEQEQKDKDAAAAVDALIDDIGEVTLESEAKIEAAQEAYDALSENAKKYVTKLPTLTQARKRLAELKAQGYEAARTKVLDYIKATTTEPKALASTKGEWTVFTAARAGRKTASYQSWYEAYLESLKKVLTDTNGTFSKSTEYARVVLALTAMGQDAASVQAGGKTYDLVTPLTRKTGGSYDAATVGTTSAAFAIIALDSKPYSAQGANAAREMVAELLTKQLPSGAWAISEAYSDENIDATAMVLAALAGHRSESGVQAAIDKAVSYLAKTQGADGGYGNACTDAQVVTALSALGMDCAAGDFAKAGGSVLSSLLSYQLSSGGFAYDAASMTSEDAMTTEQAAYALEAYYRMKHSQKRLYDLSDAENLLPEDSSVEAVEALIDEIGTVTKASGEAILAARAAYENLSSADKAKVENYDVLVQAERDYEVILTARKKERKKLLAEQYAALDLTKYSEAGLEKLREAYQDGLAAIDAAKTVEEAEQAYRLASRAIANVPTGGMTVSFRLIGDLAHGSSAHEEYVTWVTTTTYSLSEGDTVAELFIEAMDDHGLRAIGAASGYVSTIYAPDCLGGYALSEFTNGKNSGWMFCVNGKDATVGMNSCKLEDGDRVVWYYTDDYTKSSGAPYAADIAPEEYVRARLDRIVDCGENGTYSPALRYSDLGKTITFTFTPDKGYRVKEVTVDGTSLGAVTSCTVKNLSIATRISVSFTNGALPFADVYETDWFYDDVVYAYEEGLFSGTTATSFSPNAQMTRAMLVTVLYRLEGQPAVYGRSGFGDVVVNSYYEDAVTWAADNGIVTGTSTSTFSPELNVTREQMAAILYRYAQHKKYGIMATASLGAFADYAGVSAYAKPAMQWAVAEKLIGGAAGKLMPTGYATRAQVAAILHRFAENIVK